MKEEQYGRDSSSDGPIERVDGIDVVKSVEANTTPARTLTPPVAPRDRKTEQPVPTVGAASPAVSSGTPAGDVAAPVIASERSRSHLRAVERPMAGERGENGRLANAVETVGAAVGWTTGYVKSRPPAAMRSDAEKLLVASPALALVAAVGFGYLVGSMIRR